MQIKNIHDAKTHLSQLIELAYGGEDVIICKAGKPMCRLIRYRESSGKRQPGAWRGRVVIADDFDDASSVIEKVFLGE